MAVGSRRKRGNSRYPESNTIGKISINERDREESVKRIDALRERVGKILIDAEKAHNKNNGSIEESYAVITSVVTNGNVLFCIYAYSDTADDALNKARSTKERMKRGCRKGAVTPGE